ncbi:MAG: outer membrane protein transport protein [Alphaproteobacteria bacterium]|nr:outer membrane protein transport protein [Alphaproteobacteria bacterium]
MNKILTFTALGTMMLISENVLAAGFHLREQSSAAQGNAYAGATAGAEENSYAYYNVAGLTRQKGTQFSLGGSYIAPKATAKNVRDEDGNRDADVQNVVHAAISPNFALSHQVNDKLFLGIAGNSPFGMITKYDYDWAGSDHGITSDVKTATITPMVAYKATDKLSLGAGLQAQLVWAHLTNSHSKSRTGIVTVGGHAMDLGYQLGMLYEFNDSTRIGVGYRSEIKHKIKGKMKSSGSELNNIPGYEAQGAGADALMNQRISARLNTPALLSMGIYHDINDRWAVMAEYQRVFWSSFQNLTFVSRSGMNNPATPGYISRVEEKWRDTNFFALGTSYMLDEQWKLRLGIAYDQGAVRLQHRTPRIPDTDRIWYSAGLSYQYNEHLNFNAAYTYMYAHKSHLDTSLTGNAGRNVTAEYTNSIKVFAFGLNYAF